MGGKKCSLGEAPQVPAANNAPMRDQEMNDSEDTESQWTEETVEEVFTDFTNPQHPKKRSRT
jgi:hypothetical protein